jgi:hypothetical protein
MPSRLLLVLLTALLTRGVVAAEPFEGTWQLDRAKSRISAALQVQSIVMTIARIGPDVFRTVQDITFESGKTRHQEFDRTMDGKEHVIAGTEASGTRRSIIARRIGANSREITNKSDGKVTERIVSTVAPDGLSMRNVERESNGSEWVSIYVRQKVPH